LQPSKRILLVEDNPSDIELTKRAFEKSRLLNQLVVAEDGEEALSYLLNSGNPRAVALPALILLDLKLPKLPGLEVLRRIRSDSRTSRIPVVILTTSREEPDVVSAYNLGANSYIRKPVDFKQFVEAIENVGSYWLVLNEPPPSGDTSNSEQHLWALERPTLVPLTA